MQRQLAVNDQLAKSPHPDDIKPNNSYGKPYLPIGYFEKTLPIVFDSPDDPISINIDQTPKLTVSTDPSDSSQHMLSAMAKCTVSYRGITASTYGSDTETFRDATSYGQAYRKVVGTAQAYAKKRALGMLGNRFRVPDPVPSLAPVQGHGTVVHVDQEKEFMLRWDVVDTGKRALDSRNSMIYMREMASCFIQCVYDPAKHTQLGHFASSVITHTTSVINSSSHDEQQHLDNAIANFHQLYIGLTTLLATYESPKSHSLRLTQRVADRLYDGLVTVKCKPIRSIYPKYDPSELNDFLPYLNEPSSFCADMVYLYVKSVADAHDQCDDVWDAVIDRVDEWIEHSDLLTGDSGSDSSESDRE